jgi:hypothetical protein
LEWLTAEVSDCDHVTPKENRKVKLGVKAQLPAGDTTISQVN